MYRLAILCFITWIISPSCLEVTKAQTQGKSAIPVLMVKNDTASFALQISKLSVDIVVVGSIATTTFDITFYNDLGKILEGEFEFPLADGQNISRYALDINGALREGVVVEKAKARVAFENTVRRKIDPGLVEKTKGNNFKTRIYPIPAKGYKRVIIGIEQQLNYVNKDLFYQLPLYSPAPITAFSIKTTVVATAIKPALEDNGLNNFAFKKWKNAWLAEYNATNFVANSTIAFSIPFAGDNDKSVFIQEYNGKTYFYMSAAMEGQYESKRKPGSIVILWDISGSAEKRNSSKEIALIEKYISSLRDVSVKMVPFNIVPQAAEVFTIENGDASALIKRVKQYDLDGGTQLGAIDLNSYKADEILLFSDGLSTFGRNEMVLSSVPVIAINSSPNADFSYLKYVAQQTHGKFVDLTKAEIDVAVEDLAKEPLQFINTVFSEDDIEEVYVGAGTVIHNGFSMAGILKKSSATITANFGYGNTITKSKVFTIVKKDAGEYDNVKRIWASMKIDQLDLQYEKNKDDITKLGKEFSIVTQNTSLLVLDRVEDYVQYEIVPPPELQKEYYALLHQKLNEKRDEKAIALKGAVDAVNGLKHWWNRKLDPVKKKKIEMMKFTPPQVVYDSEVRTAGRGTELLTDSVAVMSSEGMADEGAVSFNRSALPAGQGEQDKLELKDVQLGYITSPPTDNQQKQMEEKQIAVSAINLHEWKPDVPYLKTLEAVPPAKYFETYISLKNDYHEQPSFFVDVARFFYEKKNKALSLQVLSNVSELKLEDAELLRVVANQLLEEGETELAVETFKQILKIREEEPQSYRDLALAYNEAAKYNEAVALLYKVLTGNWSDRFGGAKAVALNEMNAIISAHSSDVNIDTIDKQFIVAMPVDVRIVISWSSDNSDIDLWVTEPNKEKCYYEHQSTERGGRISNDITQGYGPEEYIIKKASNGDYVIEANLYGDSRQTLGGPITVKAELFTDFGRSTQKRRVINFRVMTNKEVVEIGKLRFGQ